MAKFDIDTEFVRKVAVLLKETGLNEIEYAEGDKRIRCVATPAQQVAMVSAPVAGSPQPQAAPHNVAPAAAEPAKVNGTPVTSPMVGTVYLAPQPGAPNFVKSGDKVKAGDTLLIIEAMKVMNPIKAPKDGIVAEILANDAKPVEFGEVLVVIS